MTKKVLPRVTPGKRPEKDVAKKNGIEEEARQYWDSIVKEYGIFDSGGKAIVAEGVRALVLEKKNSEYRGTVSDDMGHIAKGTEVENLEIKGYELSCTFNLADDSTVYLTLKADGDTMTGEAERNGGVVSCIFVREK